jgi:hypothetical protein
MGAPPKHLFRLEFTVLVDHSKSPARGGFRAFDTPLFSEATCTVKELAELVIKGDAFSPIHFGS